MQILDTWWQAVLQGFVRTEPLSFTLFPILAIIAGCILLTVPRATWRVFGLYVTFVHELGHAFAALMTGRFVHGLKIGWIIPGSWSAAENRASPRHGAGSGGIRCRRSWEQR